MATDGRWLDKGTIAGLGLNGGGPVGARPAGISKPGRMGLNLPERADLTQLAGAGNP